MIAKQTLNRLAAEAGFGANQRTTLLVKLTKVAELVMAHREQYEHFPRADPAALAKFDPRTKVCTMNCGPHRADPRDDKERKFLCTDCVTRAEATE